MLTPCGVPANIAGPSHAGACIACMRIAWLEAPHTTPEREADPNRGLAIITTPRPSGSPAHAS